MSFLSWMGPEGDILRQDTPFGWTMEACTVEDALEAIELAEGAEDILKGMAVRVEGTVRDPRACDGLRLALRGVAFEEGELESNRQRVIRREGDETVLEVTAARPAEGSADPAAAGPDPSQLAPAVGVQSDHPDIVAQAAAITDGYGEPVAKARAILDWVYAHVEKKMTVSLPSALDVLRRREGDCNEHTVLFVALARAAGIPATTKVGLAYHEGAFYYHAWPAVHVGAWLEMDPTWGQTTVDATHIALAEGELADQLQMVRVMGQLEIEVLDQW
jgi:transglutaminase-like putative cysteine protease